MRKYVENLPPSLFVNRKFIRIFYPPAAKGVEWGGDGWTEHTPWNFIGTFLLWNLGVIYILRLVTYSYKYVETSQKLKCVKGEGVEQYFLLTQENLTLRPFFYCYFQKCGPNFDQNSEFEVWRASYLIPRPCTKHVYTTRHNVRDNTSNSYNRTKSGARASQTSLPGTETNQPSERSKDPVTPLLEQSLYNLAPRAMFEYWPERYPLDSWS